VDKAGGALTLVENSDDGAAAAVPAPARSPLLHLHAGVWPGDEGYVVANRAGLEALVAAVASCLSSSSEEATAVADVSTADGEPTRVIVVRDDDGATSGNRWERAVLPYTDSEALDGRPAALRPWARDTVMARVLFRFITGRSA